MRNFALGRLFLSYLFALMDISTSTPIMHGMLGLFILTPTQGLFISRNTFSVLFALASLAS